jgi:hypothetical protein
MTNQRSESLLSKILGFFGQKQMGAHPQHFAGERDSALTLSEEPTAEEISRVAEEKFDPHHDDS